MGFGLCQTAKIRIFALSHKEKTAKTVFVVPGYKLFSKKMKKLLARNKISCTFAAAFGNE